MGRKKKVSKAKGVDPEAKRRDEYRQYSPVVMSPSSGPPDFRTQVEASLVPLPAYQDDELNEAQLSEYDQMVNRFCNMWERMGYHENHPNVNAANASEDELKEFLQSHHRLGPILKQYRVFVNPPRMRSLLLQYPTRELGQEYRENQGQKPLELRIKPKSGLVELDIPLNIHHNYDKEKGLQYGEALRSSRTVQQGGSYGLGGGLGIGLKPKKDERESAPPEGPSIEKMLEHFDDANNKGHVMNKITLGGKIVPFKDGDPIYMTATFRGDVCTWTSLDAMVQLSPQFSHIDALREKDKHSWRQGGAEDRSADKPEEKEAKAVNTSVKSAENPDDMDMYGGMKETAKLLKEMRDEPWQRLAWVDQDAEESFQVYDENLVYQDPDNAPQLVSEMTEEQYLDAISCPRIDPIKEGQKWMGGGEASNATSEIDDDESTLNLDDTSDEKEEQGEVLPPGVVRPTDNAQQVRIEMLCRAICSKATNNHGYLETQFKRKVHGKADYAFISPRNPHYRYYKWRFVENKAGRGYTPEQDVPRLARGAD